MNKANRYEIFSRLQRENPQPTTELVYASAFELLIAVILSAEPDWNELPESTPRQLRRLLRRCLVKSADERLHDIADARLELREAGQELTAPTPAVPAVERGPSASRLALLALGAVAAIALGAVMALWTKDDEPPSAQPSREGRVHAAGPAGVPATCPEAAVTRRRQCPSGHGRG